MGVLDGKVAIVTASGRGIGRAVAVAYGEAGASVVVASLGKEESELTVHDIESAGGSAISVPTNIGKKSEVQAMVSAAVDTYGRLDILVNTAQAYGTETNPAPLPRPQQAITATPTKTSLRSRSSSPAKHPTT